MVAALHGLELAAAALENVQNDLIALLAVGVQPRDGDAADHTAQHRQKRRLTVVALHGKITGHIPLRRSHTVHHAAVFARAGRHLDTELLHGIQRQIHIGMALVGGQHLDAALGLHQRRGKQQAADKLARHIAGQGKPAGAQPPKDRDAVRALLKAQALPVKQHLVHRLRAVKQTPRAGKLHLLGCQAEQRDHEPQGRAALIAKDRPRHRDKAARRAVALDGQGVRLLGDLCAQLGRCAQRCADVLAVLNIRNMAGAVRKGCAQHCTMRRAFARRHGGRAAEAAYMNLRVQFTSPGRWQRQPCGIWQ